MLKDTDTADKLAIRAQGLLTQYFTGKTEAERVNVFYRAFGCLNQDPREGLDTSGSAADFASACVGRLMIYGCTDDHRHALSRLLETIRDLAFGTHPPADYSDLPHKLDALCALPTRDEELAYLGGLIDEIRARARKYSALRAVGGLDSDPALHDSEDEDLEEADIAMLRLEQRSQRSKPGATGEFDDILSAFEQVRTVALLGAPGSGKSTTLRRLAADLARAALRDPQAPLPLLVALGDWRGDETLQRFIAARVPGIGWALDVLSRAGRLVLLLDGLNEVPTAMRGAKAKDIGATLRRLASKSHPPALARVDGPLPGVRVIVSCRLDDYLDALDLGLDTLTLQPLSPRRVRTVLHQWTADRGKAAEQAETLFWQLAGDARLAEVFASWCSAGRGEGAFWAISDPWNAEDIPDGIDWNGRWIWRRCAQDPRSLLRLAANPFMLNMLYLVWRVSGQLPRNRGELFSRFIDRLLAREGLILKDEDTGVWRRDARADLLRDGLASVAWRMQGERRRQDDTDPENLGVLTVLPDAEVVRLLQSAPSVPGDALFKITEDATLLERADEGKVRFRHQLLQEYFTAVAIRVHLSGGGLDADRLWPREVWWERSGWEEAAVLLAGLYSDDCTPVILWLKDIQPEVAAQCILESGAAPANRDALLRELHDAWLPRLTDMEGEPAPEARAAVGRALGRLGLDDRKGVGLTADGVPDIDWVDIPGGRFLYQDGERRTCASFRISRYPITHAQFQAFLNAEDGYAEDRWWTGFDDPKREPGQVRWPISNHPRETVSWFEAMAFCAWLGHRLGVEQQALEIRLPTEWEWERAARGTDGRIYPWSSEYEAGRANINETHGDAGPHYLAQTSAVGIYPRGAAPEGVLDLAGNVWEWCLNEYDDPEASGRGGSLSRVVRGGSWGSYQDDTRAGYRLNFHPDIRYDYRGFRVLCASPIR